MTYKLSLSDTDGTVIYQTSVSITGLPHPTAYQLKNSMAQRGLIFDLLDAIDDHEAEGKNA